jgi:hypothetical protein
MAVRWRKLCGLALLGAAACALTAGLVQGQNTFNEREVRSQRGEAEKPEIWTLDFRFKDPRQIKVNIPGRGTRLCWYLWYQVINRTGEPHTFIPNFELVTLDYPGVYRDEVLPSVQDAVKKIEDTSGYQNIRNSVTISSQPIPVSKSADEAYPRAVTGVAIWDGTNDESAAGKHELADSSRFSIFVSGLSNGWVLVDPVGGGADARPVIRRKTLQLNFKRVSDRYVVDTREVSFVPPAEWIYRVARLRLPASGNAPPMPPAKGPETKKGPEKTSN